MTEPTVWRPARRLPSINVIADGTAALFNWLLSRAYSHRLDDSDERMLRDVGLRRTLQRQLRSVLTGA